MPHKLMTVTQMTQSLILPFAIVVIGGIITYYVNVALDRDKRRYELKKETYIELLDTLLKLQRNFIDTQTIIDKTPALVGGRSSEEMVLEKTFKEIDGKLRLIRFKLPLCNGSKKIEAILDEILAELVIKRAFKYRRHNKERIDSSIERRTVA